MDDDYNPSGNASIDFELQRPVPRELPSAVYEGSYGRSQKKSIVILLTLAALLYSCADAQAIRRLAFYVIPLGYLEWIALALAVWAGCVVWRRVFKLGNYKWFVHGRAVIAKVLDTSLITTKRVNGIDTEWAYWVTLLYPDPENGTMIRSAAMSEKLNRRNLGRARLRIQPGAYATALLLPGAYDKPQLYGFLNLNPKLEFVSFGEGEGLLKSLATTLAAFGIVFALFWNVYVMMFYRTISLSHPGLIAAALIGGAVIAIPLGFALRGERWSVSGGQQDRAATRWARSAFMLLALWTLSSFTAMCLAISVNAACDTSKGTRALVNVIEIVERISHGVLREYSAKVQLPKTSDTASVVLLPENLAERESNFARVRLREGYFGWQWIDEFHFAAP